MTAKDSTRSDTAEVVTYGWQAPWLLWFLDTWAGRAWRTVGTVIAFGLFGLGSLLGGAIGVPILLRIAKRDATRSSHLVQRGVSLWFGLFCRISAGCGLLRYRLENIQGLQQTGQLVIANHPSLLDAVFLLSVTPLATCVVSGRFAHKHFSRVSVRAAGYVTNDQPKKLVNGCVAALARGHSLVIFPEGTRSQTGRPLRALRGAANIALRAQCDLRPVHIHCSTEHLSKQVRWWLAPRTVPEYTLKVMEPLRIKSYSALAESSSGRLAAVKSLTTAIEEYFDALNGLDSCTISTDMAKQLKILSIQTPEDAARHVVFDIPMALSCLAGHFPENPIVPGVVQIDWVVNWAQQQFGLGDVCKIDKIKFMQLMQPMPSDHCSVDEPSEERYRCELKFLVEKGKVTFAYYADVDSTNTAITTGQLTFSIQ